MFRRAVFRLGWLFVVATYVSVASAANDVWDNNPGGNWETGANWTDGSTPGTGDTATFNLAATYPVTFGVAPTAIQALTVSAGTVTFQSSGGAKTLNVNSGGVQDVAVTGASTLLTLGASLNPLNLTAGDDLSVQSGATLDVLFGSDVAANDLSANGLNGTLRASGSGSSLTLNSAAQHLIANTLPGSLLFQNSSTGNSIAGGLRIADNATGVTGNVSITGGSTLTVGGNLSLATQNVASQNSLLTISGTGSSLTQSGASTITVGATTNGTATISIGTTTTGGTLTTGTGLFTINSTGTVTIGSGANTGTLNANGDVTINGGVLARGSGSGFNLATGETMTIQNGGRATFTSSYIAATNAIYNIVGANSRLETIAGAAPFLNINNGAQVNVTAGGTIASASNFNVGTLGGGSLAVDGTGSSATAALAVDWGHSGGTANVTFSNNATGSFGTVAIGGNATAGTTGIASVLSGADLTVGELSIAHAGGATTSATLNINGVGSTVTGSGAANMTIGHATTGAAAINIGTTATGGTLTTGSGTLLINETGAVTLGSGANTGSLVAGGDITIDGGLLQFNNAASTFTFNFHTMNIQNGGRFATTGFRILGALSTYNVAGVGSELSVSGGDLRLNNDAEVNVSAGGAVSTTSGFSIATGGGDGTLTVAGSGSSASSGVGTMAWGASGDTATVTLSDNATGVFGDVLMANGGTVNDTDSVALVTVESGADVSFKDVTLASAELSATSATLTVTGAGSTVTLAASDVLTVGHSSVGSATVNVLDGGALTVGAGGSTILNATGTINIDGGTADLKTLTNNGGIINFTAGALSFLGNLTVGSGGVLGANLTLDSNQLLTLSGATTVDSGRTLTLNGGTLSTSSLVVNGAFHFDRGVLELTGGTISGLGNLTVPTNGEFRASGVQALQIIGLAGSTITATGNLTVGDATKVNGFYSNGTLDTGANSVTLADANDAVFDSAALVTIGDGGSPGTLAAANGLTLDFGGNVTGFGTINTPNSTAKPFINNGHIAGNSGAEPITLSGYVKGVGTLDNVVITGTDAPGFSPATVARGSVAYDGTLQIEIGGASAGSFDQINHVLGAGTATLGGTLDIDLLAGFIPTPGSSFQFITAAGGISGTFASVLLPTLPDSSWHLTYNATNVLLQVGLAGDYNLNGTVDAADYIVWRKTLGETGFALAADGNTNNQIDADDFNVWRANFGNTSGSGAGAIANAAVPEPATLVLLMIGAVGWCLKRGRAA